MRTAVVCLGHGSDERRAAPFAGRAEALIIAPPEVAARLVHLELPVVWPRPEGLLELAAPMPSMARSVAACRSLVSLLRGEGPLEARFAAGDGGGWAAGLRARQSRDLDGVKIVVEADDAIADLFAPPHLGSGAGQRLELDAVRCALRDATEVAGSEAALGALREAGWTLAEPPRALPSREGLRVSAVVTHYNLEQYLPACLDSLRAQTHPVEIVLVDDGSRPEGLAAVMAEARRDPSIKVLTGRKGGLSQARNAGVQAASGDYVLIVDADNVMRPRLVEKLLDAVLSRPGADYAAPAFRAFADQTGESRDLYCPSEIVPATLFIANTAGDACALHRREALLETGGFLPQAPVFEDWILWLQYAAAGRKGAVVPEVLFDYRVRADSMLRSRPRLQELSDFFLPARLFTPMLAAHAGEVTTLAVARLRDLLDEARREGQRGADQREAQLSQARAEAASLQRSLAESKARAAAAQGCIDALEGQGAERQRRLLELETLAAERLRSASEALAAVARLSTDNGAATARIAELTQASEALAAGRAHDRAVSEARARADEQALGELRGKLGGLESAIAELRSSSAVRLAELLRGASPSLHGAVGRVARTLIGRPGR